MVELKINDFNEEDDESGENAFEILRKHDIFAFPSPEKELEVLKEMSDEGVLSLQTLIATILTIEDCRNDIIVALSKVSKPKHAKEKEFIS